MAPDLPPSFAGIAGRALYDLEHYLSVIDPAVYRLPLDILSGSAIGQHTRHIIEFYICLLEQCDAGGPPVINYAARRRDHRIESDPGYARWIVSEISARLNGLQESKPCLLDGSEHGGEELLVVSSIGRELVYTVEHTIHHLAIVKIALKAVAPEIALPENFGIAPSTIHHRLKECAQ